METSSPTASRSDALHPAKHASCPMPHHPILRVQSLGIAWPTIDPFLFCVHHADVYPRGNGRFGPDAPLAGRQLGHDFAGIEGWRMYHGLSVPGFPSHPHRGFETVTIVRQGRVDHSDSLGAIARFGDGDVQWLTAGRGIVHAEMFPLLDTLAANPVELVQIWLNLPARNKMSAPYFKMFWASRIPRLRQVDAAGRQTEVACIAGQLGTAVAPLSPPPDSWAAAPDSDVAIWTLKLEADAQWTLPAATGPTTRRMLYLFAGQGITVNGRAVPAAAAVELHAGQAVTLVNGGQAAECLLLQGRPIAEPVAQAGPFVMNTEAELREAFADYRRTQFGGWPFADTAVVHGADPARFARHPDGRRETAE